jgi:hypothetical protein
MLFAARSNNELRATGRLRAHPVLGKVMVILAAHGRAYY